MADNSSRVNPYRYGVLEGNHVEDRFSLDHVGSQVIAYDQRRDQLPASTMKDDYRWYNSALFDQRDEIVGRNPDLAPQVYNNPSLRPFLDKPVHEVKRAELVQQSAFNDIQRLAMAVDERKPGSS